ncbi:hypothetical protein DPMN_054099 [Dreissena polymorpha]|uniref:Uncharacterized protein n=1 Tax=Dreissena polymorpha TaxID=45954 RepID=A0A9D4CPA6_DREPO|nr:hypothetical protein DPMN_054099 [Dreissena polymorpha]
MLIGNLRRVHREFGSVGSFRIVYFRWLGGALFASIKRLVSWQVGQFPCVCERVNI